MANLFKQAKALASGPPDAGIVARSNAIAEYSRATAPNAPVQAPSKPASGGPPMNPKAKYGDRPGEKRIDTSQMTKPLGSYKKGGKVKKTGLYKLHKGERVLNAKQTKKMAALGGK